MGIEKWKSAENLFPEFIDTACHKFNNRDEIPFPI